MKMGLLGLRWILLLCQCGVMLFTAAQQQTCTNRADIVFLLDSSGSISDKNPDDRRYDNWDLMLNFVVDIINGLDIGPDSTHVGLISFSEIAYNSFFLGDFTDKNSLINKVRNTIYLGASTNTAGAIYMMHTEQFGGYRDRPDAPNIAIIITDGASTVNNESTIPEAVRAQNKNISMYAVGITDEINIEELKLLSSPPHILRENYWTSPDFQTLQSLTFTFCREKEVITMTTMDVDSSTSEATNITTAQNRSPVCVIRADIVFLLDSSGSIRDKNPDDRRYDNWNLALNFVVDIINGLDIGPDSTHVGLISFSELAYNSFFLGDFTNKNSLINKVRNTIYLGASTNTAEAIYKMHTEQFGGYRDRPDAPNIAIIITDGASTINNQSTIPEAERAQNKNITMYAVGITDEINIEELQKLSSPPHLPGKNYWTSPDFQALQRVTISFCTSKDIPTFTMTTPMSTTTKYVTELAIVTGEVCSGVADVIFIMDSSGSVGASNWRTMISFMINFVRSLRANISGIRIGVVRFGDSASLVFSLNKFNTTEEITHAISNIPFLSESTNIAAGLEVARTKGFTQVSGDRPEAVNIAIMITDGRPVERKGDTEPQAKMLKAAGVTIIMVGVTNDVDHALLVRISSRGEDDVIRVEDFPALRLKLQELVDIVCISRVPPAISKEVITITSTASDTFASEPVSNTTAMSTSKEVITITSTASDTSASEPVSHTTAMSTSKDIPATDVTATSDFTTQYVTELPIVTGEVCSGVADVIFIMDSSGSVGSSNWKIMVNFMSAFVRSLSANIDGIRIGVVRFGDSASLVFPLNKFNTTEEISQAIGQIPFRSGGTNIADGFEVARRKGFTQTGGDRLEAVNIAIMITDGKPFLRENDTEPQAQMLKDAGTIIIMVGVTDDIDHDLLMRIASRGEDDVINVKDFDTLRHKLQDLVHIVCISRLPPTISECDKVADVVILIDASTNELEKWQAMRSFVYSIIQAFNISEEGIHFGIVTFSRDAQVVFYLNDQQDKETIQKLINETSPVEGITNIAGALELMQTKMFVQQHGDRFWAPNVCLLITDGQNIIQGDENVVLAEMAKNSGITLLTVGITENVNLEELRVMASSPDLAIKVESFDQLSGASNQVISLICGSVISPEGTVCMNRMDVGLIIDTSGSIRNIHDHWPTLLDFLSDFIHRLHVSQEKVRVGAVIFSEVARLMFDFNRYSDNRGVLVGLERILFLGSTTNLASGLQLANNGLFSGPGSNFGIPRVAVIITNGSPNVRANMTRPEALRLQNIGVNIIAVAIGGEVDSQLLNDITKNNVVMTTFESLRNRTEELVDLLCTQQFKSDGLFEPQSQPRPYCEDQSCVKSDMCLQLQADSQVRVCLCQNQLQGKYCYSTRPKQNEEYGLQVEDVYCYHNPKLDADMQGSTQIMAVCPRYGPLRGGTEVNMWGSNLNLTSIFFSFSQVPCIVKYSNFTYVHCTNSNASGLTTLGEPQDLHIDVMTQSVAKKSTFEDVFTFLKDPVIMDVYPLKSFLAGGINITVTGHNMDSVAKTVLEVTIRYTNLDEQVIFTSVCLTVNSSLLVCVLPEVTLKLGYDDIWSDLDIPIVQGRKQGISQAYVPITHCQKDTGTALDAEISINMDGYRKTECYTYYFNPEIYTFTEPNMKKLYLPHWPTNDDHIIIKGERLNQGPEIMHYSVIIGDEICKVTELFSNSLTCIPPSQQPSHTGLHFQGAPAVEVRVGRNIRKFVGYLQYGTPWDDRSFLIIFSVIICIGVPLLTIIIVCIGVRKARKKSSNKSASDKKLIDEDAKLNSNKRQTIAIDLE